MRIAQSKRLSGVTYDIRGRVLSEASRLEEEGHRVLKLHIGNPATFGLEAPEAVIRDVVHGLPGSQGYSESKGLLSARRAVVQHLQQEGVEGLDVADVYLGNGVSELIGLALQGLLDPGDEILIPAPDYPLWTASATLAGAKPVHYPCDEANGWMPDLEQLAVRISDATRALVVINPNNPTGAVYPRAVLEGIAAIAAERGLLLLADEIYDQIVYDGAEHVPMATVAGDQLCLSFGGLSKNYRLAGFRCGWLTLSGPKQSAREYIEGLDLLANLRLCPNVPAQHAVQAALGGLQDVDHLVTPGGRLYEQRLRAWELLNEIPGVSCVKPEGAVYVFPRLDTDLYKVDDDEELVLELLRDENLLVMPGTGFNWPAPDHLRLVTLPEVELLEDAIGRLGRFLEARAAA
jgi:alanine-synthesizing transaminase